MILRNYLTALLLLIVYTANGQSFITPFEAAGGNETATYEEVIAYYKALAKHYPSVSVDSAGETDAGLPLHIVYYNKNNTHADKLTLLINNGIHPGEPDGIDACMMLLRDAASGKIKVPDNVTLAMIPVLILAVCTTAAAAAA